MSSCRAEALAKADGTDYRVPDKAARFNDLAVQARKHLKLL